MRYLIYFVQLHEEFRVPELESAAKVEVRVPFSIFTLMLIIGFLQGIDIDIDLSTYSHAVRIPPRDALD